ncbi:hypothetical protein CEXT_658341 [Caerostris extrusa]|uniref:Uncharacterized protein n=1 Tax=Caerostris extrusa TaxID=172846 RepID=A0AAV4R3X6_CAEEX|nr:hypothetical protein CEXT_658341 [Caerostris extrusa]
MFNQTVDLLTGFSIYYKPHLLRAISRSFAIRRLRPLRGALFTTFSHYTFPFCAFAFTCVWSGNSPLGKQTMCVSGSMEPKMASLHLRMFPPRNRLVLASCHYDNQVICVERVIFN